MMVLAASDMRGAKVNKTKEKHAECEHMSCLQQNEGEHVCVCGCMPVSMVQSWRLKKEDTQKLKTMIKEGMSASRGRRGRITHCGGRTKNVSVPDAIPCAGGAQTRDTLPTH